MLSSLFLESPTRHGYDLLMSTIKDVQKRVKNNKEFSEETAAKLEISSDYYEVLNDSKSMEYQKQSSEYFSSGSKSDENIVPSDENISLKEKNPPTETVIIKDLFTKFRNRASSRRKINETSKDENEYYDPGR